jgi:CelD/BcsL family acetyltransferase involved in cellulose biosynthesis
MECSAVHIEDPRWTNLVACHPQASAFHTPAWARLIEDCYGYRAFAVIATGSDGTTVGGLPAIDVKSWLSGHRWASMPFSDYCPPLLTEGDALPAFLGALNALRESRRVPTVEVRWPAPPASGISEAAGMVMHVLDLDPDPEVTAARYAKKFRQYIRHAEREGLRTRATGTPADIDTFYDLHMKNHARVGAPVQPKRFFRLLQERILAAGNGTVLLIETPDGTAVSGAVLLHHKRRAMIKYGASDPAHLHLRCHYKLFAAAIEWACRNGMTQIDFGRTEADAAGLLQFKHGWGAREDALRYTFLGAYRDSKPSRGATLIKPVLQRLPPSVGRLVGEALYRHGA